MQQRRKSVDTSFFYEKDKLIFKGANGNEVRLTLISRLGRKVNKKMTVARTEFSQHHRGMIDLLKKGDVVIRGNGYLFPEREPVAA